MFLNMRSPRAFRQPNFSGAAAWWSQTYQEPPGERPLISRSGTDWTRRDLALEANRGNKEQVASVAPAMQDDSAAPVAIGEEGNEEEMGPPTREELLLLQTRLATMVSKVAYIENVTHHADAQNALLREENESLRAALNRLMSESQVPAGVSRQEISEERARADLLETELNELKRSHHQVILTNQDLDRRNKQYLALMTSLQRENHENYLRVLRLQDAMETLRKEAQIQHGWSLQ
jgi:hypothetical protein